MSIKIDKNDLFPIMGAESKPSHFANINLSKKFLQSICFVETNDLQQYLYECWERTRTKWLIGGYLERRSLYQSNLFVDDDRNIHLGIDIWGSVNSPIFAPLSGYIHSFAYNDKVLDYGYTLILIHQYEGQQFHTLYGHLSSRYFDIWKKGEYVEGGSVIGEIGSKEENGGWIPHLHFQMIIDMDKKKGDYIGVRSERNKEYYKANCPNPDFLIKKAP